MEQLPIVLLVKIFNDVPVYQRGKLYSLNKKFYKLLKEHEKFKIWRTKIDKIKTDAKNTFENLVEKFNSYNYSPKHHLHIWFDKKGEITMCRDLLHRPFKPFWIYQDIYNLHRQKAFNPGSGIILCTPDIKKIVRQHDLRLNLSKKTEKQKQEKPHIPYICPVHIQGPESKKSLLYFFLSLFYKEYKVVILSKNRSPDYK